MPSRVPDKIEWLKGAIWSRETWLETHGSKWPSHDVEDKKYGLDIMQDILSDYKKSMERARERKNE